MNLSVQEDGNTMQKNEGKLLFSLTESVDDTALVLNVQVGRYLDTSLILADVQVNAVRLLIKVRNACSSE